MNLICQQNKSHKSHENTRIRARVHTRVCLAKVLLIPYHSICHIFYRVAKTPHYKLHSHHLTRQHNTKPFGISKGNVPQPQLMGQYPTMSTSVPAGRC